MNKPEFSAYEINELASRARKDKTEYYSKALKFVKDTLEKTTEQLSEKQLKWLWGIKKDLDMEKEPDSWRVPKDAL
jgi:type IV secretory pathway VirB4 component